jgi:DNA-binding transcriptional regulator/RsmH inhibitor MraZ
MNLRELAGLSDKVVITGQFDRIEIWDAARWQDQRARGDRTLAAGGD